MDKDKKGYTYWYRYNHHRSTQYTNQISGKQQDKCSEGETEELRNTGDYGRMCPQITPCRWILHSVPCISNSNAAFCNFQEMKTTHLFNLYGVIL